MTEPAGVRKAHALFNTFEKWQRLDQAPKPKFFLARIFVNIANFFKGKVYQAQVKQQLSGLPEAFPIPPLNLTSSLVGAYQRGEYLRSFPLLTNMDDDSKPWYAQWQAFKASCNIPGLQVKAIKEAQGARQAPNTPAGMQKALHAAALMQGLRGEAQAEFQIAIETVRGGLKGVETTSEDWSGVIKTLAELNYALGRFQVGESTTARELIVNKLVELRGQLEKAISEQTARIEDLQQAVEKKTLRVEELSGAATSRQEGAEEEGRAYALMGKRMKRGLDGLPWSLKEHFAEPVSWVRGAVDGHTNPQQSLLKLRKVLTPQLVFDEMLSRAPEQLKSILREYVDDPDGLVRGLREYVARFVATAKPGEETFALLEQMRATSARAKEYAWVMRRRPEDVSEKDWAAGYEVLRRAASALNHYIGRGKSYEERSEEWAVTTAARDQADERVVGAEGELNRLHEELGSAQAILRGYEAQLREIPEGLIPSGQPESPIPVFGDEVPEHFR